VLIELLQRHFHNLLVNVCLAITVKQSWFTNVVDYLLSDSSCAFTYTLQNASHWLRTLVNRPFIKWTCQIWIAFFTLIFSLVVCLLQCNDGFYIWSIIQRITPATFLILLHTFFDRRLLRLKQMPKYLLLKLSSLFSFSLLFAFKLLPELLHICFEF